MDSVIREIGSFLPVDDEGRLLRVGDAAKIPADWQLAVDACIQTYRERLGARLHSVYVRGSVARGEPVAGVSDLDTFAVVTDPRPERGCWVQDEALWPLAEAIASRFSQVTKVELALVPIAATEAPDCPFTRFALAHTAACVLGPDLGADAPRLVAGPKTVFQLPHLPGDLAGLRGWRDEGEPWAVLGPWIGKRILRAALEWGIETHGRYSRDLWPCLVAFAQVCPEGESDMRRLLELTLEPPDDDALWFEVIEAATRWIRP